MNEQDNPWKVIAQKNAYDNPWIKVTEFEVINPGGGKGIYGKVHFKNRAVGIVPLDESLNTWLVGQYRFPTDNYSWEIPEGGCPEDLDLVEGAKKELSEETGLSAKSWSLILEMDISNSVTDEHAFVFLARGLQQRAASPEETEKLAIKKMPFEEAYRMVESGSIVDSISVAAILKVKLMIADGRIS